MYAYIFANIILILYLLIFRNKVGFVGKFFSINNFKNNSKIEKIFFTMFIFEILFFKMLNSIFFNDYILLSETVFIFGVNFEILQTLEIIENSKLLTKKAEVKNEQKSFQ